MNYSHPMPTSATAMGPSQAATSYLGAQQPDVPRVLEQHEKSLQNVLNQIGAVNGRLLNLSDRLFGSQPEPVSENGKTPPSPPTVRRLEDLVMLANDYLAVTHRYVERLERL